jgi:hypothetical protein
LIPRTTAAVCACILLSALGCGSNSPPSGDGGICSADGGSGFGGDTQLTTDCAADSLPDAGYPAFKTCAPTATGSPKFIASQTVAGPSTAVPTTTCVRPSKTTALKSVAQTFCKRPVGTQLTFTVPSGTGSVTVVSQAVSSQDAPVAITSGASCTWIPNGTAPTSVIDPNRRVLLDSPYTGGSAEDAGIYYGSLATSTGAMTFPDTTFLIDEVNRNSGLPAGPWTLTVDDLANDCRFFSNCTGGSTTGVYDVTIIAKPVAPTSGTIDVGFYLVDTSPSLTAAAAAAAAQSPTTALGRAIQSLETIYSKAGLCLGTVTFYDVQPWARQRFSAGIDADRTEPCGNLDQMFALLSQPGNTLNFFLVSSIISSSQGGLTTVGIDGTIPGPSSVGGGVHSGAAVSIADLDALSSGPTGTSGCLSTVDYRACGADKVAYIIAHEGGHWLGLYHTVESLGDTFDPLTDTATCPCSTCRPASATQTCGSDLQKSYQMTTVDCTKSSSCGSGDNLMFWLLGSASTGTLSPQQQQVVRGNPVVQ